jgi:hypothetical protein
MLRVFPLEDFLEEEENNKGIIFLYLEENEDEELKFSFLEKEIASSLLSLKLSYMSSSKIGVSLV